MYALTYGRNQRFVGLVAAADVEQAAARLRRDRAQRALQRGPLQVDPVGRAPEQRLHGSDSQTANVLSPNLCGKQRMRLGRKPAATSSGQRSRTS